MDCPTITVHMGKHYKAHIDSGAAISLVRYSTYHTIDNILKTAIQETLIQLNTADGSLMTALGIMTLQLRIADFKFSHNFIICDRLPEMELLFCIDVQKKFSLSYAWVREKNCYIQKESRFFTYTRHYEQKVNLAVVKSALKILPRHNGFIPIKIKGHVIKGHTAYFISDQDSKKGKDPNIHIIIGIHNIKGKTYVNVLFSNYTNKHITFNKGEYVEHLELPIEDMQQIPEDPESLTTHSITTKRMMVEKV